MPAQRMTAVGELFCPPVAPALALCSRLLSVMVVGDSVFRLECCGCMCCGCSAARRCEQLHRASCVRAWVVFASTFVYSHGVRRGCARGHQLSGPALPLPVPERERRGIEVEKGFASQDR